MFLYNLTLQAPTAISHAVLGHFSGEKFQELVVARQQHLELWRPDAATGKLSTTHSQNLFCRIRSLAQFRLPGGTKDYVAVGSDAGALAVLEYDVRARRFVAVQYHEFGRTGLRRQQPGQYVAADPKGRAVMVAAIERAKIVYVVTRDADAAVVLASPLEANRAQTACVDVVGVDVGYENPLFAALEIDYESSGGGDRSLVYYELDLGLNHVVRKWSTPVDATSNRLIALPGGDDGPSGVLVCSEGFIEYRHSTADGAHRVAIPRRAGGPDDDGVAGPLVVASAVHRMKGAFFILAQADTGDLYKVTVPYTADGGVSRIGVRYFDTIPPASALRILRAGFLFAASMEGSQQLFQFENLGDDDDDTAGEAWFQPHDLASLALVDEVEGASPVVRSQVLNLANEESPQVYALCGRGARSSLKIIRHGLEVSELAASELPGTPQGVWAVRRREGADHDDLIVVSFLDATLALSTGDEVEEVTDSGLLATTPTLCLHSVEGGGLVQVTPRAVRHVLPGGRVNEWLPPDGRAIGCAAANERQVVVVLAGSGRAIYFELHPELGVLREHAEPLTAGSGITCVALAPVPGGRRHSPFLAVGCEDQTVRVFALDAPRCLEALSMQATSAVAGSVAFAAHGGRPHLYMGLRNGLLMRAAVDPLSGELDATRTRFLGARGVQLCKARVGAGEAVLALSSAPWLCHEHRGSLRTTPLSYDALDHAAGFSSEQCPQGLVCVAGNTLRILTVDWPDALFNQASIPLDLTPRDFVLNAASRHLAIIETEHAHYSPAQLRAAGCDAATAELPGAQFGLARSRSGHWASLIRVLDPFTGESTHIEELDGNRAAVSLAQVRFGAGEELLAVGCTAGLMLQPRACDSASIRLYRWIGDGRALELVHETPVDGGVPQCLLPFASQLLVAVGATLRLYDMGIKRLLKKAQSPVARNAIASVRPHPTAPDRLFVADVHDSVCLAVFDHAVRAFHTVIDDALPRFATAVHVLDDGDTVLAGDKFGNLFGLRVPEAVARTLDTEPARLRLERPKLGGAAPHKWDHIAEFHVGDIVTSLTTCALAAGGRPVVLYSTLLGSLQAAVPFVSKSDRELFRALEAALRRRAPPVSGRDHLAYRSAFAPVRSVVDGDLCEQYFALDNETREAIADDVDRSQQDILKKLEDMRSMFAV
ncbi:pre-mRNA-splicing factor rse1 [Coemansia spiralis]|nr:pre-mRNA-splicing factor rse1 [Coemansia spiralis]